MRNALLAVAALLATTMIAKWPMLASIAWTPPTLAGTRLYVRDRGTIMALDLSALR